MKNKRLWLSVTLTVLVVVCAMLILSRINETRSNAAPAAPTDLILPPDIQTTAQPDTKKYDDLPDVDISSWEYLIASQAHNISDYVPDVSKISGSLTTIHADNCREVPTRLRTLVQQANTGMSSREILEYISQAIDFIIYTERSHGVRRVTEIAEVQGMQGDVVTIAPIVRFEHDPNDPEHSGWFVPTGERFMRRHIEKMANEGVFVDDDWFNPQAVF